MNIAQFKQLMEMKKWQLEIKAREMRLATKKKTKAIIARDIAKALEIQQQKDWDVITGKVHE